MRVKNFKNNIDIENVIKCRGNFCTSQNRVYIRNNIFLTFILNSFLIHNFLKQN